VVTANMIKGGHLTTLILSFYLGQQYFLIQKPFTNEKCLV